MAQTLSTNSELSPEYDKVGTLPKRKQWLYYISLNFGYADLCCIEDNRGKTVTQRLSVKRSISFILGFGRNCYYFLGHFWSESYDFLTTFVPAQSFRLYVNAYVFGGLFFSHIITERGNTPCVGTVSIYYKKQLFKGSSVSNFRKSTSCVGSHRHKSQS